MFQKRIEDLGFVIGVFFAIISTILIIVGFVATEVPAHGVNLNLLTGGVMGLFAVVMLAISIFSTPDT